MKALLLSTTVVAATMAFSQVPVNPAQAKPLGVGASAPDAQLRNLDGKAVTMRQALAGRSTVLIFYRGGWCPFCNAHLAKLKTVEGELKKRGYQIIGISPDQPEFLKQTLDQNKIDYQLLSDGQAEALKAFGVAFRLDDETFGKYKNQYNLDLEKRSGGTHHILPVPSVFIIGKDGKIKFAHSDPDYRVRLDPTKILAAAK
jgi:peroxiredoxin